MGSFLSHDHYAGGVFPCGEILFGNDVVVTAQEPVAWRYHSVSVWFLGGHTVADLKGGAVRCDSFRGWFHPVTVSPRDEVSWRGEYPSPGTERTDSVL